jgi:hypothetical protein
MALESLRQELDEITSRVRQVMKQTRARIFRGNTRCEGKRPPIHRINVRSPASVILTRSTLIFRPLAALMVSVTIVASSASPSFANVSAGKP